MTFTTLPPCYLPHRLPPFNKTHCTTPLPVPGMDAAPHTPATPPITTHTPLPAALLIYLPPLPHHTYLPLHATTPRSTPAHIHTFTPRTHAMHTTAHGLQRDISPLPAALFVVTATSSPAWRLLPRWTLPGTPSVCTGIHTVPIYSVRPISSGKA